MSRDEKVSFRRYRRIYNCWLACWPRRLHDAPCRWSMRPPKKAPCPFSRRFARFSPVGSARACRFWRPSIRFSGCRYHRLIWVSWFFVVLCLYILIGSDRSVLPISWRHVPSRRLRPDQSCFLSFWASTSYPAVQIINAVARTAVRLFLYSNIAPTTHFILHESLFRHPSAISLQYTVTTELHIGRRFRPCWVYIQRHCPIEFVCCSDALNMANNKGHGILPILVPLVVPHHAVIVRQYVESIESKP
jgi:hypothetical protein